MQRPNRAYVKRTKNDRVVEILEINAAEFLRYRQTGWEAATAQEFLDWRRKERELSTKAGSEDGDSVSGDPKPETDPTAKSSEPVAVKGGKKGPGGK